MGGAPEKMMRYALLVALVRASSHWLDAYEQRGYFVLPRVFSARDAGFPHMRPRQGGARMACRRKMKYCMSKCI